MKNFTASTRRLPPRARLLSSSPAGSRAFRLSAFCGWVLPAVLAALPFRAPAQDAPSYGPFLPVVPGVPSEEAEAAYNAARTPQAVITVDGVPVTVARPPSLPKTDPATFSTRLVAAEAPAALSAVGGVFPAVSLAPGVGAPAGGKGTATGTSSAPRNNSDGAPPPPVNVTLQFAPARAGALVWVNLLDGGNLAALDAEGKVVNAPGGFFMEISAAGTIAFTYQAPGSGGHYQVAARLDNVTTILPFDVPDASGH